MRQIYFLKRDPNQRYALARSMQCASNLICVAASALELRAQGGQHAHSLFQPPHTDRLPQVGRFTSDRSENVWGGLVIGTLAKSPWVAVEEFTPITIIWGFRKLSIGPMLRLLQKGHYFWNLPETAKTNFLRNVT